MVEEKPVPEDTQDRQLEESKYQVVSLSDTPILPSDVELCHKMTR